MKRLCVFCGSHFGKRPAYQDAAEALGKALVRYDITLVYGGGNVGLMGVIADSVLEAGGEVIGVIPEFLVARELAHPDVTELHVVRSMHERKAKMADLSDGFIALPGGFGTFEEFCEIITWSQLGLHQKPHGLLNVEGYYNALVTMFDKATEDEFIRADHRSLVLEASDPDILIQKMMAFRPHVAPKWISQDETLEKT